jgi:hypothetical protein
MVGARKQTRAHNNTSETAARVVPVPSPPTKAAKAGERAKVDPIPKTIPTIIRNTARTKVMFFTLQ